MEGEERCDDKIKRDGESEEQKDDEPPNHSTPYQMTPQHVWISVDDFFSSSELSQPSPRVLQAKPVLRLLPLASDLPPRPRFFQEFPLLVFRRLTQDQCLVEYDPSPSWWQYPQTKRRVETR